MTSPNFVLCTIRGRVFRPTHLVSALTIFGVNLCVSVDIFGFFVSISEVFVCVLSFCMFGAYISA